MRTVARESGVEMMGSIGFFVQLDPDGAQLVADTAAALIGVLLSLRQYRILQKTLAVKWNAKDIPYKTGAASQGGGPQVCTNG